MGQLMILLSIAFSSETPRSVPMPTVGNRADSEDRRRARLLPTAGGREANRSIQTPGLFVFRLASFTRHR
jgi:hypothetical protein